MISQRNKIECDEEKRGNESLKPETRMKDISFTNSIVRFGGYGYGGINRASKSSQGCMLGWIICIMTLIQLRTLRFKIISLINPVVISSIHRRR